MKRKKTETVGSGSWVGQIDRAERSTAKLIFAIILGQREYYVSAVYSEQVFIRAALSGKGAVCTEYTTTPVSSHTPLVGPVAPERII
jgi:hypothetical protein